MPIDRSADTSVLYRSMVTVMGPTPPGTGVMSTPSAHTLEVDVADDACRRAGG
jgi:hypothetical protein